MNIYKLAGLYFSLIGLAVSGQEKIVASFNIEATRLNHGGMPVSVSLEGIDFNTDNGALRLFELNGKIRIGVPCQLEPGNSPRLWWIPDGKMQSKGNRKFILVKDSTFIAKNEILAELNAKSLIISQNHQNILQYNSSEVLPPDTVNPVYRRSAFIHPLWSPSGNILTRVNPPDHWHHVGIWNPWTKTRFEGHSTDFWNLAEGQGTVRFGGFDALISGPVFGGFKVRQEHIDFQCKGGDKVAINEVWNIRVWNVGIIDGVKVWLWDLTSTLACATSSPITLEAYRYGGGLGFRATEEWTSKNSHVQTSEGKMRPEADGSRARWCLVNGEFSGNGSSGILFMSNPSNREHPEPMRVWPENANNGRGDLFFEFCPIRYKSWELKPGNEYVLRYRMLIYDGKIENQLAEQLWNDFAHPPEVHIEK